MRWRWCGAPAAGAVAEGGWATLSGGEKQTGGEGRLGKMNRGGGTRAWVAGWARGREQVARGWAQGGRGWVSVSGWDG